MAAVTHARNGSVSVVTLDDGKVNAFDDALIDGIHAALDEAADSRAVVLAGRDGVFSGGFDLAVVGQGGPAAEDLVRRGGQLLVRLYTSPVPVVAACTGHAVALGAVVLLAADLRIGSSGAFSVGLNEVGIGMPVPPLLLALAEQRLNAARRTEAVLLARLWTPEQAVEVGFLDDVVEVEDVLSVSVDHAKRLGTALQPDAFRVTSERMRARVAAEGLSSLSAPM